MPSYQDIKSRLQVVERKVDFILHAFAIQDQTNPFSRPSSLYDEYYRIQAAEHIILPTQAEVEAEGFEAVPVEEVSE